MTEDQWDRGIVERNLLQLKIRVFVSESPTDVAHYFSLEVDVRSTPIIAVQLHVNVDVALVVADADGSRSVEVNFARYFEFFFD